MLLGKKEKKIIRIEGMSCGHCSQRVTDALNAIDSVKAKVDLAAKTATVTMKSAVSDEILKEAVERAGFKVVGIE